MNLCKRSCDDYRLVSPFHIALMYRLFATFIDPFNWFIQEKITFALMWSPCTSVFRIYDFHFQPKNQSHFRCILTYVMLFNHAVCCWKLQSAHNSIRSVRWYRFGCKIIKMVVFACILVCMPYR